MAAGAAALAPRALDAQQPPDYTLTIGPCTLEASPHHTLHTIGYNNQVPGPLLRLREGQPVTIDVTNRTDTPEVVHWHGLFLQPGVDGATEEGTPFIQPGQTTRIRFTPHPAGLRWYHTHIFAGTDLKKAQYTAQHGFLLIEPRNNPAPWDQEIFLALHDWDGALVASDDGSLNPVYNVSTVNGKTLGSGDPIRVRPGQRVLLHILNSSPTEVHWLSLSGHRFHVLALDGNPVPRPATVPMLRLAPAERVTALVTMDHPGVWVLGEVRKHIQAAGMGIVLEYANATGKPLWQQPQQLLWSYQPFGNPVSAPAKPDPSIHEIPLVLSSRFEGHGAMERWLINGKPYPDLPEPVLQQGRRYRIRYINKSLDDHPMHLHRHLFELTHLPEGGTRGIRKDTVLVPSHTEVAVEFTADNPGSTLLHCHQQDHMDQGMKMLLRYA